MSILFTIGQYWTGPDRHLTGGTTPFSVPITGGVPNQEVMSTACAQVGSVSQDPRGGGFLAIHSVCRTDADTGLFYYPIPPGPPRKLVGPENSIDVSLQQPAWVAAPR